MQGIRKFTEWITTLFKVVGGVSLVIMTAIACLNMCMRLLGKPLAPAYELVSYLGAVTVALPLGYAQLKKSHITVDILSTRFPAGLRKIITGISLVISSAFFSIAAWKVGQHAANFCVQESCQRLPVWLFTPLLMWWLFLAVSWRFVFWLTSRHFSRVQGEEINERPDRNRSIDGLTFFS